MAKLAVCLLAAAWSLSAQYVGSKACYGCHSEIYRSFHPKTDMGRSMSLASEWKTDVLPAQATLGLPGSTHTSPFHTMNQAGNKANRSPACFLCSSR